jgi:hypothetical protein
MDEVAKLCDNALRAKTKAKNRQNNTQKSVANGRRIENEDM